MPTSTEATESGRPGLPRNRREAWLRDPRLPVWLLVAGMAATVLGRLALGLIRDSVTDDAYFYAVLARNLAGGRGWTFDGVTTTNGAHPLLLGLEVLVAGLLGPRATPYAFYAALEVLFALVFLGFLAALAALARRSGPSPEGRTFFLAAGLAAGILFLPGYHSVISSGMESTLAFPLGALVFALWFRKRDFAAGLAGAALVLARLDTLVFFLAPLALVRFAATFRSGGGWRPAAGTAFRLLAPAAVLVSAYMGFNALRFGWPVPIHGVLKSSFPRLHVQAFQLLGPPAGLAATLRSPHVVGHYFFAAAVVLLLRRRRFGDPLGLATFAMLAVYVATEANFVLFQKWSKAVPDWYLWQSLFASALAFCLGAVPVLPARVVRLAAAGLGLYLGLHGAWNVAYPLAHTVHHWGEPVTFWRTPLVEQLRAQPQADLWAATDCGREAFWSERRIVDLDGLIAGFELQDRIAKREMVPYLRELGVTRVLVYAWDRKQVEGREYEPMYRSYVNPAAFSGNYDAFPFYVYSYRHGVYSDTLLLHRAQETWRSEPYPDGAGLARDLTYDLRRAP